jgi:hypothetical protein
MTLLPMSFLASAQSVFAYSSVQGDYIGQGETRSFTPANSTFSVYGNSENVTVSIDGNNGDWWFIELAAPRGTRLAPGRFVDAERAPFRTGRSAGVDVSGNGRGCNEIWGEIGVRQITFDKSGAIATFEASFLQRCEGPNSPALAGVVRYKAAQLSLKLVSAAGDYVGAGIKKTYYNDASTFTLSGTTTYLQFGASGLRDDWLALIAPPVGKKLKVGSYITRRSADATHAGFDFFGNGRGCNTSTGVLDIKRITTSATGNVLKLYADFEQHCEGAGPALSGTIHYGL